MTYWLEDANGWRGDLASNMGLAALRDHGPDPLRQMIEQGGTDEADLLAAVVSACDVEPYRYIRTMLNGATVPIIVTDGCEDEESRHESGQMSRSNQNHAPAGESDGGQFTSGGGNGTPTATPTAAKHAKTLEKSKADLAKDLAKQAKKAAAADKDNEKNYNHHATPGVYTAKEAVKVYRGAGYMNMNAYARGLPVTYPYGPKTTEDLRAVTAALDDAIAATQPREAMTVYRGITDLRRMGADKPEDLVGKTFVDQGFVSTARDEGPAGDMFATTGSNKDGIPAVLQIHVPKGAHLFGLRSIENEDILPRGGSFTVRHVSPPDPKKRSWAWTAEVDYTPPTARPPIRVRADAAQPVAGETFTDRLLDWSTDTVQFTARARFNPNHAPAGTAEGGEFTSGKQSDLAKDLAASGEFGSATEAGKYASWLPYSESGALYSPLMKNKDARHEVELWRHPEHGVMVNAVARGVNPGYRMTEEERASALKTANVLDEAIDGAAQLNPGETVWRAIAPQAVAKMFAGQDLGKLEGTTITDNGFASTTRNQKFASFWGGQTASKDQPGIIVEMDLPSGTHALNIERALGMPFKTPEAETLLPRGGKFTFGPGRSEFDGAVWRYHVTYTPTGFTSLPARSNPNHVPAGSPQGGQFTSANDVALVDAHLTKLHPGGKVVAAFPRAEDRPFAKQVKTAEAQIAGQAYETAFAWSKDGTPLFSTTQNKAAEVRFSEDQLRQFKDAVVTHNHPSGYSISDNDARLAIDHDLAEIRAVTKDGVYSLRRPASGWPDWTGLRAQIAVAANKYDGETHAAIAKAAKAKAGLAAIAALQRDADAHHNDRIWQKVAKWNDIPYEHIQ